MRRHKRISLQEVVEVCDCPVLAHKCLRVSELLEYLFDHTEADRVSCVNSLKLDIVCFLSSLFKYVVEVDETLAFVGNQIQFYVCFQFDSHAKVH